MTFDATMLAEVNRVLHRRLFDPELQAIALVLTWFRWQTRQDVPVRHHARYAVRQVLAGRDLPGIDAGRSPDAFKLAKWSGGSMSEVMDRRPGPVQEAIAKEEWQLFQEALSDRERAMAAAFMEGKPGTEIAKLFGISEGRVTQIRQAMMKHLD